MKTDDQAADQSVSGWARVLALLLTVWEPISFAVVAAGAFNAISVRGIPVAAMLALRLATTAACVAAGRALLDRRPAAPSLVKFALAASAVVQVVAAVTPYFPSNRLPGQTPLYVGGTLLYYGAWLAYVVRSKRMGNLFG